MGPICLMPIQNVERQNFYLILRSDHFVDDAKIAFELFEDALFCKDIPNKEMGLKKKIRTTDWRSLPLDCYYVGLETRFKTCKEIYHGKNIT